MGLPEIQDQSTPSLEVKQIVTNFIEDKGRQTNLSYNVIPLLIDVIPTAALIQHCLLISVQETYVKQLLRKPMLFSL